MGTPSDPDNPNYEIGTECTACIELFAPGQTPKFVTVTFEGVEACPILGELPPTFGGAILEQVPGAPCQWTAYIDREGQAHEFLWTLNMAPPWRSSLTYDIDGAGMFVGKDAEKCIAAFQNERECGLGHLTEGGTGCITWGPNGG